MLRTLRNKKGVTLIELLAVVIILGIIAAIAVPTIGGLISNQRQNAAEAEFTNIQEAARLYFTSEDPDADYVSLATLVEEDYIDWEGVITSFDYDGNDDVDGNETSTSSETGNVYYAQIFDSNGDIITGTAGTAITYDDDNTPTTTWTIGDPIYIDSYLVHGEAATAA